MSMLLHLVIFLGALILPNTGQDWPAPSVPRKTFTLNKIGGFMFREPGVSNYTTMLLREDLDELIIGARGAIFALDLTNITKKKAMVTWNVAEEKQLECSNKGRNYKLECQNYIRIIHKMPHNQMYVCGTNAFNPTCDYMNYTDGRLTLENKQEEAKGKCPYDPYQRYASEFVDGDLYFATSVNFLSSEYALMRSSPESIQTERMWLNDPRFIGMIHIAEGESNPEGDDDKIYLFFTEKAVEYDSYSVTEVSRVARVCKGDMGGLRTLQKKFTSFLKARIDCSHNSKLPFLIQDVFHFCPGDWTTCVFYAVFTSQTDGSKYSTVCAYSIGEIRKVFAESKFKTLVSAGISVTKWITHTDEIPSPRPGACINNEARRSGYNTSLDLPDRTLKFIRENPLLDQAVKPMQVDPLLVKTGAAFTRIVVSSVTALNGDIHQVLFIGTESGSVLKTVNYAGEMVIIEEVQLFDISDPVKILRLSTKALYAGSEVATAQIPLSACEQYSSCVDCVLARDPYCGWNIITDKCSVISTIHPDNRRQTIQHLQDGNASYCPSAESPLVKNISLYLGSTIRLPCQPGSNLAHVKWKRNESPLESSDMYYIQSDSLLIVNATADIVGQYTCRSEESSHKTSFITQHAMYHLSLAAGDRLELQSQLAEKEGNVKTLKILVIFFAFMFVALALWNFKKGHFPCICKRRA